jgi:predicted CXXCH cytochrome family protein
MMSLRFSLSSFFSALVLMGFVFASGAMAKTVKSEAYVGSAQCKGCHQQAYADWQGSHHDWAMKEADEKTVLGDFSDVTFDHYGEKTRLYKEGNKFLVETDNAKGERQVFTVAYTFGFYPLQQYLIPFEDGRYQALNVTWDSRPKAEGGQRWFHLYPDEAIPYNDQLHWTGAYHNWNSRCAECHSTNLQRNYSADTNSYDTTWSEINVACESCHGPGQKHLQWLNSDQQGKEKAAHKGFEQSIASMTQWVRDKDAATASPHPIQAENGKKSEHTFQIDTCGTCHSRRSLIDDPNKAGDFHNKHNLQLLREPLYYADGQIRDEVYVLGSFMQSKMFHQGVVCSNCHNPHSLELKAPGNAVCLQCHSPEVFDTKSHHQHQADSSGAQCVNCHMPETTYMVVDPRRDHSLRIPRPDLSAQTGAPNACIQCHEEQTDQWAADAMGQWLKSTNKTLPTHRGELFSAYQQGSEEAGNALLSLAMNSQQPAIIRATALTSLRPSQQTILAAQTNLYDESPLVRRAAVQALAVLPEVQRRVDLLPLAKDESKSVRMEVASQLLDIDATQLNSAQQKTLQDLQREYEQLLQLHADTPSGQLNIGVMRQAQNKPEKAEQAYRQAMLLDPKNILPRLNLADLYRGLNRDSDGEPLLREAISLSPQSAEPYHSLGLLLIRQKQLPEAIEQLTRASELAPNNMRYGYVNALALKEAGKLDEAYETLQQLDQRFPQQAELLSALLQISHQRKQWSAAMGYAQTLLQLRPDDRQLPQMVNYYRNQLAR